MKDNIDLTENRIFSGNLSGNLSLQNHLVEALLPKMPWNKYIRLVESEDDLDLEKQRISIIATGNKSERAKVNYYRQMDDDNYCDCCGAAMHKMPWHMEIGVCQKCDDEFHKHHKGKFPWGGKETIQNSMILNI